MFCQLLHLTTINHSILANSKFQVKMRQEIEETDSQDRDQLPYCTAVIMETLRYLVGFGLGAPRAIWEDLVVDGYKLPKGIPKP